MISSILYLFYSFLLIAWGVLLSPIFLYRAWRHNKYLPGISQRLGRLQEGLRSDGRSTIWFHSCSVGETLSVQPLVQALHQRFPDARLVFSTITQTGQAIARQRFARFGESNFFYFPIDLAFVANRVMDWIKPAIIVIVDTEIWPNVLRAAHRRHVPVMLVNGRISPNSFRFYRWARPVLRAVFENYEMLLMKSEEDAARILQIGAPKDKILVSGNLKFDMDMAENEDVSARADSLDEAFALTADRGAVIVAGSTHPGEEQVLLEVLRQVRRVPGLEQTRLMLAPRHPERFDAVAIAALEAGFRVRRRTDRGEPDEGAEILLLDTLGELVLAYRFAHVAFVGGSLVPRGGHSIMEPALYAKPIVVGPSMENFPNIIDEFRTRGGVRQIGAMADREAQIRQLTEVMVSLLQNPKTCEALGRAAHSVFEGNQGATQFTADRIAAAYDAVARRRGMLQAG